MPGGLEAVYGVHAVEALLARGRAPSELWVQAGEAELRLNEIIEQARAAGSRVTLKAREELDALSTGGGAHQGLVALCAPLATENETGLKLRLDGWSHEEAPLFLVLDSVTDPHNLGACLRSADAAGAHGVIVPKDKSASLNATVRKVACGAAEVVPVYQVTNLARTLDAMKEAGVWVLGTAGEAEAMAFEADFTGPVAIVMGAEGKGMRRLTREHCDSLIKLPMAGSVSSLNVSVAAGICLFEAVRQRRNG
ncbi:23S rRNA (guanosine(2251)-2'-O)-methyltransferase RlmB [Cobetia marina]|uniref:23S rRNA (guanosine(2251)-2'-O)-methyltransferase RlmB n=1 Tax=Cobetia TaxID=204286 RepID=UPI000D459CC5|nr:MULTISPECIES: 23S rRNA (guanosine(2251)-2'-O)-methyltransferase RlmB [Cobetia]MDO6787273.1 23S rRNA (guanosine(2251)-2'-O)-methyltransferase RlmB [Cobetia marina]POR05120.1 23S rRNA (guanosine(2251)-2'-O)-methyltransferase RlmB [Cobetia sp. MM1IDA2H-1]